MAEEQQQAPEQHENLPVEENYEGGEFGNESYDADLEGGGTAVAAGGTSKIMGIIVLVLMSIGIMYFLFVPSEEDIKESEKEEVKVYDEAREEEGAPTYNVAQAPEGEIEPVIEDITPAEETVTEIVELEVPDLPDLEVAAIPSEEEFDLTPKFSEEDIFSKQEELQKAKEEEAALEAAEQAAAEAGQEIGAEAPDGDTEISAPSEGENPGEISPEITPGPTAENQGTAQTPMFLMNGGGGGFTGEETALVADSSAEMVEATKLPYPERTIAQGKLIDSVLETAINTDFEGKVRAIVSRDIFADFGRSILIPKGSRLIGSYSGSVTRGQTRVLINWDRLIRPDAVDIMINSPASDQFGRSGVPGAVDNKYLELFNNSILLSLITIGTAIAIEEASNSDGVSTEEDSNGDTTTSATPSDLASQEIINTVSETAQTVLDGILNTEPTITVPHGTRIKIFVNQDLIFPENVISSNSTDGVVFVK